MGYSEAICPAHLPQHDIQCSAFLDCYASNSRVSLVDWPSHFESTSAGMIADLARGCGEGQARRRHDCRRGKLKLALHMPHHPWQPGGGLVPVAK